MVSLLDLPAEILHTIFALVDIGSLARWLVILCPDELIDDDSATKMQLNGEMRLRAIAIDAHRHTVARFGAVHMKDSPCSLRSPFQFPRRLGYYHCLFCDIFHKLPTSITDRQMACVINNMRWLVDLPRTVCFHVFRTVLHFINNVEEFTHHTGPINPRLVVLYEGGLYPRCDNIKKSLVVWVNGDLPLTLQIHYSVIICHRSDSRLPMEADVMGCSLIPYFI